MKQLFSFLFCGMLFFGSASASAQSFSVVHDTIYITTGGATYSLPDSVLVMPTPSINIQWKILITDFPPDWQYNLGFCDPTACYVMSSLYPSGSVQASSFGTGFGTSGGNIFTYSNDLTTATPGCHYLRVRMNNAAIPADTAMVTYIVCKPGISQVAHITSTSEDEISFYPNPAINTLNVVYSEMLGVKNIAIYSIIGKQMNIFSTTDNKGAMLNIENIPSGIYYVRLLNENGVVIATRRFMKQ